MTPQYIQDDQEAGDLARALRTTSSVALDCEAAGFHRYTDRLCLIQVSIRESTFLVDPLAFDPAPILRPVLEDPEVEVVMHGADFDLRLLDRDLDIRLGGLFDTQVAAALAGEEALGLSSLLEKLLGVGLSKKFQRADWAQRPLPAEMKDYAASDTRHLHELADTLRNRLEELGRLDWALEECRALEEVRWEAPESGDPVAGVKGAREMEPRELAALREALEWRDRIGRERDRALFRVAGDGVLVAIARTRPRDLDALAGTQGMSSSLAREEGRALLARLRRVESLPEEELEAYPQPSSPRPRRPPPEIEERTRRLKKVRNRLAGELGLDRGTLISNAVLEEIARREPRTLESLRAVPGVREWHARAAGEELLAVLNGNGKR